MSARNITVEICASLLIVLFIYTPVSKFLKFQEYVYSMEAQPFAHWFQKILIWAIPAAELTAVGLLAFPKTKKAGFWLSLALMSAFTVYIILIQLNYFGTIPCSCGGIIQTWGWTKHLIFNLAFLIIIVSALILNQQNTNYLINKVALD